MELLLYTMMAYAIKDQQHHETVLHHHGLSLVWFSKTGALSEQVLTGSVKEVGSTHSVSDAKVAFKK